MEPWMLAAHEAIRQLVARYAHAADRGRFDDLASSFARDGLLELPDGRTVRGPDGVRTFLVETAATMRSGATGSALRHHVSSHVVDVESATRATGYAYFLVLTPRGPDHWGRYADRYVVEDGAWRFAHRRVRVDGRGTSTA